MAQKQMNKLKVKIQNTQSESVQVVGTKVLLQIRMKRFKIDTKDINRLNLLCTKHDLVIKKVKSPEKYELE